MTQLQREPTCVDCAVPIQPGTPALCVATPSVHLCLCPACAASHPSRQAALDHLWKLVRQLEERE
jgi:hypothetical protein